jgi:hypothetical protein
MPHGRDRGKHPAPVLICLAPRPWSTVRAVGAQIAVYRYDTRRQPSSTLGGLMRCCAARPNWSPALIAHAITCLHAPSPCHQ